MPKGFCQPPVSSTKEQTPNHCQLEPAFTRHLGKIFPLVLFFTSTWFVLQEDVRVRWPLRLGEGPLLRWRVRERRHLWLRRIYTVHCASNRRHLPLHRWVVPVMRRSNHQDSSSQLEFSEALVWKGPFEPWKKIIFNTKQLWKHSNETFVGLLVTAKIIYNPWEPLASYRYLPLDPNVEVLWKLDLNLHNAQLHA